MCRLKALLFSCILLILNPLTAQIITVDGHAYLEGAVAHDSVMVAFERSVPYPLSDTVYTDASGYYSVVIQNGIYDVFFSKSGYLPDSLMELVLYSSTTLGDMTLEEIMLRGALSGILPAGTYEVGESIWVAAGDTLIIEPGVTLMFRNNVQFDVFGLLLAIGTETDSIKFTRYDSTMSWGGIDINPSADDSTTIAYCIVEYSNSSGIYVNDANPSIRNSDIRYNNGTPEYSDDNGGGIYLANSGALIENVVIRDNGAIGYGSGGGILSTGSLFPFIKRAIIKNNTANHGGGIYLSCDAKMEVENSLICGNVGGGIYCQSSGTLVANNLVIVYNTEAGIENWDGECIMLNCIIAHNLGDYEGGGISNRVGGQISINYCNVWGNEGGNFYGTPEWVGVNVTTNFNGDSCDPYYNIQLEPLFVDTSIGDYHIQEHSPCRNSGGMFAITSWLDTVYAPDTDWDGESRPMGHGYDIGIDEYADSVLYLCGYVVEHHILGPYSEHNDPLCALGAPDDEFVSLGVGGWIELAILNPVSDSIVVFEASGETKTITDEGFAVYGKEFLGETWTLIGNGLGTTVFVLPTELDALRYVRIVDDGDGDPESTAPGFDLDAVAGGSVSRISENQSIAKPLLSINAYPNPFNSSCVIIIDVGDACMRPAEIEIFDLNGRCVWKDNLSGQNGSDPDQSGRRRLDGQGEALWTPDKSITSGVYLIKATIGNNAVYKRIVFIK